MPTLSEHLETENVQPQTFLVEWFLTLYTKPFSQDVASRI